MANMETHTNSKTPRSHFGFLDSLFARLGSPEPCDATGCKTSSVVVKHGSLNDRCAISHLAETDFCGDDIFFEDLGLALRGGQSTVPHPRQIMFPEAVSSSIFVGLGQVRQLYAMIKNDSVETSDGNKDAVGDEQMRLLFGFARVNLSIRK
jgi:hypothetical protein